VFAIERDEFALVEHGHFGVQRVSPAKAMGGGERGGANGKTVVDSDPLDAWKLRETLRVFQSKNRIPTHAADRTSNLGSKKRWNDYRCVCGGYTIQKRAAIATRDLGWSVGAYPDARVDGKH
jgi:hypothetical protein